MIHTTKLNITLRLDPEDQIAEIVSDLPDYCSSTFQNVKDNLWEGEFTASCEVAPELAAGDLVNDVSPYFPRLLELKDIYKASFALEIALGSPAPNIFKLETYTVALLAALGASITIFDNDAQSA